VVREATDRSKRASVGKQNAAATIVPEAVPLRHAERLVRTAAIVAAGGHGLRFGGVRPKQLYEVGGRAVLERSVMLLLEHPAVDEVVVALPAELLADPPPYLRVSRKPLRLVAGGIRRQDSVSNAFAATSDEADIIVIHDAVRPFAGADLISRTIAAAVESGAAVAALASRDTVKRVRPAGDASLAFVQETLPRDQIFLAQTPQAFTRQVLRDALALVEHGHEATDEATLAERAGHPVRVVEGELSNIKITLPADLPVAEAIAREGSGPPSTTFRVGTGYDLHRLVQGRPLILGGVAIVFDRGLHGHSDADVVCHAVTDAVLGAAGAGDIGRHFPDTDARYENASSLDLLRRAMEIVHHQGYVVINVDVVVVAEAPKMTPHVDAMRANLSGAMGIDAGRISIKGKTNEGVDATGRGEAIAAHAVALLCKRSE
jgi:2-C-methyl-D-erythritol 4-phosphate cytidylyltransferase / 2-C-methyl-D-erythritol 2,4-cyclodiphosphate synthase